MKIKEHTCPPKAKTGCDAGVPLLAPKLKLGWVGAPNEGAGLAGAPKGEGFTAGGLPNTLFCCGVSDLNMKTEDCSGLGATGAGAAPPKLKPPVGAGLLACGAEKLNACVLLASGALKENPLEAGAVGAAVDPNENTGFDSAAVVVAVD